MAFDNITGTTSNSFSVGNLQSLDGYVNFIANVGTANNPRIAWSIANNEWQYSKDGITFNSIGSGGAPIDLGSTIYQYLYWNGTKWTASSDLTLVGNSNRNIKQNASTNSDGYSLYIFSADGAANYNGGSLWLVGGASGAGTTLYGGSVSISGGTGRSPGGSLSRTLAGDIYIQSYWNPGTAPTMSGSTLIGQVSDGYTHPGLYIPKSGNLNIGYSAMKFYSSAAGGQTKTIGIEQNGLAGDHLQILSGNASGGVNNGGDLILNTGFGCGGGFIGNMYLGATAGNIELGSGAVAIGIAGTIASTYQMLFSPGINSIFIGANDTLSCTAGGMINLPSLFKINSTPVSTNVTATSLNNLTAGFVDGYWHETAGGTGQTSFTTGDLLYASGPTTLSKVAIGTDGYFLKSSGGIPTWADNTSTTPYIGGLAPILIEFDQGSVPFPYTITDLTVPPDTTESCDYIFLQRQVGGGSDGCSTLNIGHVAFTRSGTGAVKMLVTGDPVSSEYDGWSIAKINQNGLYAQVINFDGGVITGSVRVTVTGHPPEAPGPGTVFRSKLVFFNRLRVSA